MKKRKTVIASLAILGVLFITAGVSYAFFSYSREGTTGNTITTGALTFHYEENSQGISLIDAMPMTDNNGIQQTNYFDFTVTSDTSSAIKIPYYITARRKGNDSSLDGSVKLYLAEVTDKGEQTESEDAVTLENNKTISKFSELSTYTNASLNITAAKNEKILYEGEVPVNSTNYTKDYRLRMWFSNTQGDITYNQTITGSCSDSTYTTRETCIAAHKDWTDVATSTPQTFSIIVNVYAEGESQVTPAVTPYVIGTKYTLDPGDGTPRDFYILSVNDTTNEVRLIMDRNITQGTANPTINYTNAMAYFDNGDGLTIKNSWTNVESIDLPGAQEIADAVGNTSWDVTTATKTDWFFLDPENGIYQNTNRVANASNLSNFRWLFNYTKGCTNYGCDSTTSLSSPEATGYWTKSLISDDSSRAWDMSFTGNLYRNTISDSGNDGVRPVITISKSNLSSLIN